MAAPQSNATTEFTVSLLLGKTYVLSAKGTGGVWYEPTVGSGITADQLNCDNERRAVTLTPTADETIRVWRGGSLDFQIEETTGHPDENIPGDYVSVGMGVDEGSTVEGAANFTYANGNTIAAGVVTEAKGADLTTDWGALFEPAATNYADGADDLSGGAETVDLTTAGTGDYTLSVEGTAAVTVAAGTATGTGFGQATEGNPVTFNLTGAGTVTLTLDSGTLDKVDGLAIKQIEKNPFATSWIPTDGATANRTADDASGMFEEANFSQTEGSWIARLNGIARPTDGQHAIFNLTAASTQGPLYRVNNDLRANDGTDESSVTFAAGDDGDDVYVAVDFGTGSTKEVGYRNITDTGSWTWDGTPTNYDGGFPTDAAGINILNGQTEPVRIRDFHGFTTRVGKTNIEGIY